MQLSIFCVIGGNGDTSVQTDGSNDLSLTFSDISSKQREPV